MTIGYSFNQFIENLPFNLIIIKIPNNNKLICKSIYNINPDIEIIEFLI